MNYVERLKKKKATVNEMLCKKHLLSGTIYDFPEEQDCYEDLAESLLVDLVAGGNVTIVADKRKAIELLGEGLKWAKSVMS